MRTLPKRSSQGSWVRDGFYDRKSGTHFVLAWFDRPARIAETYSLCGEEKRAEAVIPKAGVFALVVTYPEIHLVGGQSWARAETSGESPRRARFPGFRGV